MEKYREEYSMLNVGDSVKICIENLNPYYETETMWLTSSMYKFNGIETTVSRIIRFYGNTRRVYELEGVNNKQVMPFTWLRKALLKLKSDNYDAGYAACGYEIASGHGVSGKDCDGHCKHKEECFQTLEENRLFPCPLNRL